MSTKILIYSQLIFTTSNLQPFYGRKL
uniref:Uncharacterized protein n=1 Tax=Arundo donax TaxID=35708 RepID=A0A0A9DLQ0_ARUDO